MSNLLTLLRRLADALSGPATPVTPDTMSLNEWADLPAHHPVCD